MSRFLEKKKHPKAADILGYNFENMSLKWQTGKPDKDCGVYMMHHIKQFNGTSYSYPDLTRVIVFFYFSYFLLFT